VDDMDEIVQEFLVESHENLDQLDQDLVRLEQEPDSRELLASVFRTIHTIKGTSGFLAYSSLESVTHVGENLLSKLRDGRLELTPQITSALLEMVDAIRSLLGAIEATGTEGDPDHRSLVEKLTSLLEPAVVEAAVTESAPAAPVAETAPAEVIPAEAVTAEAVTREPVTREPVTPEPVTREPVTPGAITEVPAQRSAEPDFMPTGPLLGEVMVNTGRVHPDDVAVAVAEQHLGDQRPLGEILIDHGVTTPQEVSESLEAQSESRRSAADSTIRVDVELLDSLMRLVGELVLTRNQIVQHASTRADTDLVRSSQRLNLIASELQEGVMKTRMQPIDNVWSRLTRVVRDLGLSCGKQVRLEMEGRDTELDKTILEAIKDPLTHCVRNSVDHGIETPEERLAAGKPAEGRLLLRAFHEGGQVNIEIIDDGAGIDPRKVGAKALERGLVTPDQLARMSEREVLLLIFQAGFSTAAAVTNVSGRGVGMDVVKTNVEKIGGTVDVTSVVGRGSTFRIKIPLTLAIIPALTITCAGDRYAIPQVSLVELVRLEAAQTVAGKGIEHISGAPVLRLRGNLLPLVYLDEQLGLPARREEAEAIFIVVLQADDRQFGLVVHEVLDTEEIVVKPLGSQLKGIGVFAGATILGDGAVALILDCLAVAQRANVVHAAGDRTGLERSARSGVESAPVVPLLVVNCGGSRRAAIPLEMVTRLEEFELATIEHVGNHEVVQYRGAILPLVRMSRFLGSFADDTSERLQVVVYSEGGRSVGLVVDAILDITEEVLVASSDLDDHGLLGSAVVQDKITEMLDIRQAILAADPNFYSAGDAAREGAFA